MSERFDAIVVGVGAMGSAACYHLAKRGVRVLGIEQFDIPHDRGSSHGYSRMIRTAYYEHPDYVPLLKRAFLLWREIENEALVKLLYVIGGLYMGNRDSELIAGSLKSCEKHSLPHELLEIQDLRSQFRQFQVPDDFVGLLEHDAGFLLPELCIATHVDLAMRHGATIRGNEPVVEWKADATSARVTTTRGTYEADELIFCGGAWSDRLLRDLGVPLVVTRQVLGWVQPRVRDLFQLGVLPVWAIGNDDGSLSYGFPMHPGSPGLKIAHHAPGATTTADTIDRTPRPDDEQSFRPAIKRFVPDADGPLMSMRICMYTNSPDHHFIIDRSPAHERVTLACGFSGHGFKFASVVGEILADLAIKKSSALPIGFLGLSRFK